MVSYVDNSVKFYFKNGRFTNAIQFNSSHQAPHAADVVSFIFETLKQKHLLSEKKAAQFKDFSVTLFPPDDTQATSRLLIQSDQSSIHIKTLKSDTAALLIQGLTPGEAPHTARIIDCLAWFIQGVLTLVAEVFKSRQSSTTLRDTPEKYPLPIMDQNMPSLVLHESTLRGIPDQDHTSFINSLVQALAHAPQEVREAIVKALDDEEEENFEMAKITDILKDLKAQVADGQNEVREIRQSQGFFSACFDARFQKLTRDIDETLKRIENLQIKKNKIKAYQHASRTLGKSLRSYRDKGNLDLRAVRGLIPHSTPGFEEDAGELLDAVFATLGYSPEKECDYALRLDVPEEGNVDLQELIHETNLEGSPPSLVIKLNRFPRGKNGPKFDSSVELPSNHLLKMGSANYKINALVLHYGNDVSGHYYNYIQKEDRWYKVDDDEVTEIQEFPKNTTNRIYLLFLEKVE
ncbi:MAG: hypothetical protein JSS10_07505 [Verrucomicrobia bacterium]|nr:hypothetical protein [Verrucomicrobiota bacterium]